MRGSLGRRTSRASIVLAGGFAALSLGVGTAWADGPTVTGTPTAIMKDGTSVAITGTGFNPSSSIYVMECSKAGASSCDLGGVKVLTAGADGSVSTTFQVRMGTVGDGQCIAGSTTCFLAVTDGTAANTKAVKLTFPKAITQPTTKPVTKAANGPTASKTTKTTATSTTSLGNGSTSKATKTPTAVQAGSGGLANDGNSSTHLPLALAIGLAGTALAGGTLHQSRRGRQAQG